MRKPVLISSQYQPMLVSMKLVKPSEAPLIPAGSISPHAPKAATRTSDTTNTRFRVIRLNPRRSTGPDINFFLVLMGCQRRSFERNRPELQSHLLSRAQHFELLTQDPVSVHLPQRLSELLGLGHPFQAGHPGYGELGKLDGRTVGLVASDHAITAVRAGHATVLPEHEMWFALIRRRINEAGVRHGQSPVSVLQVGLARSLRAAIRRHAAETLRHKGRYRARSLHRHALFDSAFDMDHHYFARHLLFRKIGRLQGTVVALRRDRHIQPGEAFPKAARAGQVPVFTPHANTRLEHLHRRLSRKTVIRLLQAKVVHHAKRVGC